MKNKNILISLILFSILLLSIGNVSSATNDITIRNPTANKIITGISQELNSTIEGSSGVYNVTWYYNAKNGTLMTIAIISNTSASQASFNTTWNTLGVEDDNSITINTTSRNLINAIVDDATVTGIWLDNGVPTITFNSSNFADAVEINKGNSFTVAVTPNTTIGIDNCSVSTNSITKTITGAGNGCISSYATSDFSLENTGIHTLTIIAYDGNANTSTITRTLDMQGAIGGPQGTPKAVEEVTSATPKETTQVQKAGFIESISNFFKEMGNWFKGIFL